MTVEETKPSEAQEVQEVQEIAKPQEAAAEGFDKLSRTEAVKRAVSENRGTATVEAKAPVSEEVPTKAEIKQDLAEDVEAPSAFSKEEKEAWKRGDVQAIQKAYRRVETLRQQEVSRAQAAERKALTESQPWRELGKMAEPYIKAREKDGVTPQQALKEALDLVHHFKEKKDDPATIKAELKKIGIDLDKAPGEKKIDNSQNDNLLTRLSALERLEETRKFESLAQTFDSVFKDLGSEKNRTGEAVFPDLFDTSESGKQLATDIGSLAFDERFQAGVLRRFPDADLKIMVREAYKFLGGRVQGEAAKVSPSNQQQEIERKKRAALSSPAKQMSRNDRAGLTGKLTRSAAVKQALRDIREH